MSAIEYSLIFLSIVISYVVTVVMSGWGRQIKHYDRTKFSATLLMWTITLFLYLLFIWLWTFSYHLRFLENYFWFTLFLFRPLLIYFCLEILIPEHGEADYSEHFARKSRKFFITLSILWLYELALIILMRSSLATLRASTAWVILPISISLIFFTNRTYVRVLTVVSLVVVLFSFVAQVLEW